ncbi:Acyl-coenzyme A oxidase 3, peroxisomal [Turnera subulata]|uniref:Acyl-coenzyme A oxidase n=1 Tax=Turnera subulata TaxID=218843 RepID=A0A9Q0G2R0_9ROSI|nr:Acyl-coenzyme A oxidase 3, peroxisomal [Turnera subulata]
MYVCIIFSTESILHCNEEPDRTQRNQPKPKPKSRMSETDTATQRRTRILANHFLLHEDICTPSKTTLYSSACLSYTPAEHGETISFDTREMRKILDWHNIEDRDWLFGLMMQEKLFNPIERGGRVFTIPDYEKPMHYQREMTRRRIKWLAERGVFEGWLTGRGEGWDLKRLALEEAAVVYDHSLAIKCGVHFLLWGHTLKFLGTKRHHEKWLKPTEDYKIMGCFAMTELGHGSNVRGLETVATYDAKTSEFVINTPCETAQKYWIGGAAEDAGYAVVFTQLNMNGKNQGLHAFIVQIRDVNGNPMPNIRIADCGHKIGLNGVDNGRIWFDNVRVPRENLLNSVADVTADGQYVSDIKDPDRRSVAFMSPLTSGRVTTAVTAIQGSKVSLTIAVRYALTRRAFSVTPNGPEVRLLDYPSHQRRLLPLLAKTYAMVFAANYLKMLYVKRTPRSIKNLHLVSNAMKAVFSWHNMRTLQLALHNFVYICCFQECREACGGQGLKTENRIGQMKAEFDPQSTFEGDNTYMMHQVSKSLLAEYEVNKKRNKPFKGLGLDHMNGPCPVLPSQLTSTILRSSQFQVDAFRLRERDLLSRFATEVAEYQARGENKENAFLQAYQVAEDLARAFSDRLTLESFTEAEARVPAGSLKDVLGLVRSLYAIICMDEDASFLRYGYLTMQNVAVVRKEVRKLCSELRPHALVLVTSFGIPDAFLSPIAYDWIEANSSSSAKL